VIVTRIDSINQKKSKVYIEEQLAFVLYKGELSRYRIKVDKELPKEIYEEIVEQILVKRAKKYCLNLLQSLDRTEEQLRRKLKDKYYPEEVIKRAIEYVKSYGYIDDSSYANRYIECYKERKSRQQILLDLMKKGIKRSIIDDVYEEKLPQDETLMIQRLYEKKVGTKTELSEKEKQKLYMFLMRKGFSSADIIRVMRESRENLNVDEGFA